MNPGAQRKDADERLKGLNSYALAADSQREEKGEAWKLILNTQVCSKIATWKLAGYLSN